VFVHHHLAGPRAPKHQLTRGPARPRQLLYAAYGRARSFPASQAEAPHFAAGRAHSWAEVANTPRCIPRAQPGCWAALAKRAQSNLG
jgi:hypothetical protein